MEPYDPSAENLDETVTPEQYYLDHIATCEPGWWAAYETLYNRAEISLRQQMFLFEGTTEEAIEAASKHEWLFWPFEYVEQVFYRGTCVLMIEHDTEKGGWGMVATYEDGSTLRCEDYEFEVVQTTVDELVGGLDEQYIELQALFKMLGMNRDTEVRASLGTRSEGGVDPETRKVTGVGWEVFQDVDDWSMAFYYNGQPKAGWYVSTRGSLYQLSVYLADEDKHYWSNNLGREPGLEEGQGVSSEIAYSWLLGDGN